MALTMDITAENTEIGAALTGAYIRVLSIHADEHNNVDFVVGTYVSKAARDANKRPVKNERFILSNFDHNDAKAMKKKLYEHLKTLEQFAAAADEPATP